MYRQGNWIGYCTNVHAGSDLMVTKANLAKYASPIKRICSPDSPMGIGLWLSSQAVNDMVSQRQVEPFGEWLAQSGLVPFTFNGFPYGNFHQEVVKHLVYQPTWAEDSRREYSQQLATVMDCLLPDEFDGRKMEGSISTLPLAWNDKSATPDFLQQCANQLLELARFLEQLENEKGRLIYYCIEPEPGCLLQTSETCVDFFTRYLFGQSAATDELVKRYLRVCHDVCHAAVMFEEQGEFLSKIMDAGIRIGKVQVSSAVHLPLSDLSEEDQVLAMNQLREFREPRYLHQTVLQQEDGSTHFFEDLPQAMDALDADLSRYLEARVHFHVPIFLSSIGMLKTSQPDILRCLEVSQHISDLTHFEAETYAWNVLPKGIRPDQTDSRPAEFDGLAAGIAREINWLTGLG